MPLVRCCLLQLYTYGAVVAVSYDNMMSTSHNLLRVLISRVKLTNISYHAALLSTPCQPTTRSSSNDLIVLTPCDFVGYYGTYYVVVLWRWHMIICSSLCYVVWCCVISLKCVRLWAFFGLFWVGLCNVVLFYVRFRVKLRACVWLCVILCYFVGFFSFCVFFGLCRALLLFCVCRCMKSRDLGRFCVILCQVCFFAIVCSLVRWSVLGCGFLSELY